MIFLDPFIYNDFICLDKYMKEQNIITKFVFYYNYSLYITNFYKYSWHTPCPKCFLSNLESHLRGSQYTDGLNFQLLIDLIYKKNLNFPVSADISSYDLLSLMFFLKKQLLEFESNENYVVNELCEISLENNQTVKDNSVYWEMCDCYE
jgi:McbB family protein